MFCELLGRLAVAIGQVVQGLILRPFVELHVGVFFQLLVVVALQGTLLHLQQGAVVELEKFSSRLRLVSLGGGSYRPPELSSGLFFLFLLALGPDVFLGDELHIDIIGEDPHSLGVGADAVLDAHAIDPGPAGWGEMRGEFFDLLHGLVLLGEDAVDVVADRVEGLVVVETMLTRMEGGEGVGGFGPQRQVD